MSRNIEINIKQESQGGESSYEVLYPKTVSKNILYLGEDAVTVWDKLNNLNPDSTFEVGDILLTSKKNINNDVFKLCDGSYIEDVENLNNMVNLSLGANLQNQWQIKDSENNNVYLSIQYLQYSNGTYFCIGSTGTESSYNLYYTKNIAQNWIKLEKPSSTSYDYLDQLIDIYFKDGFYYLLAEGYYSAVSRRYIVFNKISENFSSIDSVSELGYSESYYFSNFLIEDDGLWAFAFSQNSTPYFYCFKSLFTSEKIISFSKKLSYKTSSSFSGGVPIREVIKFSDTDWRFYCYYSKTLSAGILNGFTSSINLNNTSSSGNSFLNNFSVDTNNNSYGYIRGKIDNIYYTSLGKYGTMGIYGFSSVGEISNFTNYVSDEYVRDFREIFIGNSFFKSSKDSTLKFNKAGNTNVYKISNDYTSSVYYTYHRIFVDNTCYSYAKTRDSNNFGAEYYRKASIEIKLPSLASPDNDKAINYYIKIK